jgi:uncharacterized protein (DUF2062 family)
MARMLVSLRQRWRQWLAAVVRIRDTPEANARGLAIGFFFGVSLLWGLQIALAVLASHLLRGNKVLAAAMTAVSNPLTNLPLYGLCYLVGHLLVGGPDQLSGLGQLASVEGLVALGPGFLMTMAVGTTLVGVLGGIAIYFSAHLILAKIRRWHGDRRKAVRPHRC